MDACELQRGFHQAEEETEGLVASPLGAQGDRRLLVALIVVKGAVGVDQGALLAVQWDYSQECRQGQSSLLERHPYTHTPTTVMPALGPQRAHPPYRSADAVTLRARRSAAADGEPTAPPFPVFGAPARSVTFAQGFQNCNLAK